MEVKKVHDPKVSYDGKNWREDWQEENKKPWLWGGMVPLCMLIAIVVATLVACCIG